MQPNVPAATPIEEFAPADPGQLRSPTAREQSPLDESGQGPESQVVAKLLGRTPQDLRQLVRDFDRDVHVRTLPDSLQPGTPTSDGRPRLVGRNERSITDTGRTEMSATAMEVVRQA